MVAWEKRRIREKEEMSKECERWRGMDEEEMIMVLKKIEEQEVGQYNERKERAMMRNM